MAGPSFTFEEEAPQPSKGPSFEFVGPEPTKEPVPVLPDVGKSVASKAALAVPGVAIGAIGSVEEFLTKDIPTFARNAGLNLAERLDWVSPAQAEAGKKEPLYSGQDEDQRKGWRAPFTGYPTYKGVTESLQQDKWTPDIMRYKPQTPQGKIAGAAVEAGVQALPGGGGTMVGRALTGAGAGAAGEAAGVLAEGNASEPYARIGGALAGGIAVGKLSNIVRATMLPAGARDKVSQALSEDLSKGQTAMSPEQISEALQRGAPVTIMDMAGPRTNAILKRYADMSPEAREASVRYNTFLQERAAETANRVEQNLQRVAGQSVDAPAVAAAQQRLGKAERDTVYGIARAEPASNSIPSSAFGEVLERPVVKKAMKDAEITSQNNPEFNITIPQRTPGSPEVPSRWENTPRGLVEVPGTPAVAPAITDANLSFWDQVKRELDNEISKARRAGDNVTAASAENARNRIVAELDKRIPSYKTARDTASETFGAANAPEAGYRFLTTANEFKLKDIRRALENYSPEQRDLFAVGIMHKINEDIQKGQIGTLARKFSDTERGNRAFQERVREALGQDKFNEVKGLIITENLMAKAKELQFLRSGHSPVEVGIAAGAGTALAEMMWTVVNGAQLLGQSPSLGNAVAVGTAAAMGKMALSKMERSVAERIIPLATSGRPEDVKRLGELAQHYPVIDQALNKITATIGAAVTQHEQMKSRQERQQRASGGKVSGIDHGSEADKLIKMMEDARKSNSTKTEHLLSQDDSAIAKALAVANQHI